ncbi:MAG TPA: amidase, partial [Burkholderiales bacterium]|nr:amidase [Burkholderiales bacterium]
LLHGMTLGVKDIFDTADLPTEYGSTIYAGHRPAWDAACVALARAAGVVVIGKTVTTEFATMVPARTVHPLDPRRTPGGSSSGSAAAVAAGMARFAFGSQTVGSTIRPAAYCGVVGYKPTFGTLSRSGMKMGAESLDTVGVIARTVDDAALLAAGSGMRKDLVGGEVLAKPRLAVCRSPNWHQMSREGADAFLATVDRLGGQGARILEREVPFDALDKAATTILFYEMARGLAYEMAHHRARVSPMLVQRVEEGSSIPYAEYAKALAYAADCRKNLTELMADVDAILTPSATGEAPLGLESTGNTAMNRLWTLLYGPCVTVPAGVGPSGMPLGVQLVGLPGSDARALAAARWIERGL